MPRGMTEEHRDGARDPAATDETTDNARDGAKKRRDPKEPLAVIGLGASAGGVAALQQFFADMKPDTGLAFVVVMHLSPEFESQLAGVIQQKTSMPVTQVTKPVKVRPDHVYVIPPNNQLTFEDSTLHLVAPQQQLGRRVTIDLFFRTLAQAYGQRAVCVIMSGTDSDGVIGLKHIRAQGGLTIVQDPNEAEFDSMPASAISTGMVDWVLPVAEMPDKLLEFVRNENRMKLPPEIPEADEPDAKVNDAPGGETVSDETRSSEDEEAIGKVLANVRAQTGHDFGHYKRATVLRRIARRLQVNSLETVPQYLEFLRTHPAEGRSLLEDLLIGVTHFFRDRDAFASLEAHIPQLFAGKKPDDEVRVWVAGCATGEEAYSIAILLCEQCARLENPPKVQIFATDIDEESISNARDALYPSMIEADVSPERLREFFVTDHGRYRVRKEIREKVLFAAHNLLKDPPFSRCDLISCRNLLIYLTTQAQHNIFDIFHFALRSGGVLFLGGAENHTQAQPLFSPLDATHRIFVRRSMPRSSWTMPVIPVRPSGPPTRTRKSSRTRPLPALTQDVAENSARRGAAAIHAGQTRRDALFGELHLRLLEQYGPPSAVVNELHEIVHLSGSAGRYLQFVAGEPTANITKVVNPALAIELRTALFKAAQEKGNVKGSATAVEVHGRTEVITLEVRPMRAQDEASGFFLVLFGKESEVEPHAVATTRQDSIVRSTDEQIQFLKEQLAETIEQYEASNEELQASNEKLQAMNEEMRSATEELETSKEELQSVNEELTTVNYELKLNVEELSGTNADLNNLMASTDIGTIFLDRQLRIHRFTPSAQKLFNLIPADVGRPISDITTRLHYKGFVQDLEQVLQDLHTIEREVPLGDTDPQWYLMRIAPYRTGEDRIAGIVATFINITRRKQAEDELRNVSETLQTELKRFNTVMAAVPDFVYQFDLNGRFTYVSQSLLDLWRKNADEAIGRNFHELDYTPELATKLQAQIQQVIDTRQLLKDETPYTSAIGERMYEYLFFPITDENGALQGVGGVTRDITNRKNAEQAMRESEERFRTVADNVPQVIWTNDADGKANYFNRRWYEFSGLSYSESVGPGWQAIVHPADEPSSVERWRQALAKSEVFDCEYRLRGRDGEYRWFIGRNVPLRDGQGNVMNWFGSATDIHRLKTTEAALRESDERFRLLVEGTRDYAMFLLDVDNIITFWSYGAERVFGWMHDDAVGQSGDLIFVPEDKERGAVEKEIGLALQNGRAPDRRWHLRKDGSRLWVDGVLMRLDHPNGELRGFAKIARDATDQQRQEEELRYARDQLEQRVLERTADLMATNNRLEHAIIDREQLERELLEISERERRRVGQDLHDLVCQELTATALFLKSAGNRIGHEDAAKALSEAAQIVNRNVAVARDLARGFQPTVFGPGGLTEAMRALCKQANQQGRIHCILKLPKVIRLRDESLALNLFRIAQEAVRNAISHSGGDEIILCIEREREMIRMVVEDNGKGFRARKRSKGLGLHIMRYRANVLGGTLMIDPRPKGGTKVTCEVPVKRVESKKTKNQRP
jgi:two-component system CheB/CheR fusion protein